MSRIDTVLEGDDFECISLRAYGEGSRGSLIKQANPHLSGGLQVGASITVPEVLPEPARNVVATSGEEVSISIDGQLFQHWVSYMLETGIDKIAKFEFTAPFESVHEAFRENFKPLQYRRVEIHIGGVQQFRGVLLNVAPNTSAGGNFVTVSGYASCGVLQDCSMPASAFDDTFTESGGLEWQHVTIEQIVSEMAKVWGFFPVFEAKSEVQVEQVNAEGVNFAQVAIQPNGKVWSFWIRLAKQRNLVIGSNSTGNPMFSRTTKEAPAQRLEGGVSPVVRITSEIRPQAVFSHVTGLCSMFEGDDGGQYTVENPHLRGILRPYVFTVVDAESPALAKGAVDAAAGRMFGAAIAYELRLVGARTAAGALWAPNTMLSLTAPEVQIYRETDFLVRSVRFKGNPKASTSTLRIVLPEAFDGARGVPKRMPWDDS